MEGVVFVIGLVLMPLGYLAALVAHRTGRSTRVPLGLVAAGLGLVAGTWLVISVAMASVVPSAGLAGLPALVVPIAAGTVIAISLTRRGARRIAGAFIAALGVGWLTLWTSWVADAIRPAPGGQAFLSFGVPVGIVGLVSGLPLLVLRDPTADLRSPDVLARRRRIGAFGAALMDRARLGPLTPTFVLTVATAITVSTDPTGTLRGLPGVVITVLVAILVNELELRLVPGRVRPALEAFHWVGRHELARFRSITGRTIPVTKGGAARWLATPAREPELEYRSELLVWLDRRADALAVVARMPEHTPMQRLQKALEADLISWSADGHERGIDFAGLAAAVEDEAERLRADGLVAYRASQHRFAAGDPDWLAPLTAHRAKLGHAADGLHARAMRKATLLPAVLVALFLSVLIQSGPMAA